MGEEQRKKEKRGKKKGFGFGHVMEDKWGDSIGPL